MERLASVHIDGQERATTRRQIGHLVVTSGRVIIADALMPFEVPLAVDVPAGRYPVAIWRVDVPGDEERNAFATLEISDEPAETVEWAQHEVKPHQPLPPDEVPGFPVDSWHAGFMDADARAALDEQFSIQDDMLEREHAANSGTWNIHSFATTPANVVTFFSGMGSGVYPAMIFRDRSGKICIVAIDFKLSDEDDFN